MQTATTKRWTLKAPRKGKPVARALRNCLDLCKSRREITGIHGRPETKHTTTLWSPMSAPDPAMTVKLRAVGERFGWEITRENAEAVGEAVKALAVELEAMVSVQDASGILSDSHCVWYTGPLRPGEDAL